MRYFLFLEQGGGCDYTIGCGVKLTEIRANSLEQAKAEAVEEIGDDWRGRHERGIEKASLLVTEDRIDLRDLLDQKKAERAQKAADARAKRKEAAERAQYEAMKKKFG